MPRLTQSTSRIKFAHRVNNALGVWKVLVVLLMAFVYSTAIAEEPSRPGYYHPLNQFDPPGRIARWAAQTGRFSPNYKQPIKVTLPSTGRVTVFTGPAAKPNDINAPAQFGVSPGYVYRLKVSHMPEFPGVELYPSIEIVDRLHPPAGKVDEFPIPINLSEIEVRHVLEGRYVTKIVYLEQPQLASHYGANDPEGVLELRRTVNLLTEADRRGRPLVIVRVGGRMPPANGNRQAFFATGSPVWLPTKQPAQEMSFNGNLRKQITQ